VWHTPTQRVATSARLQHSILQPVGMQPGRTDTFTGSRADSAPLHIHAHASRRPCRYAEVSIDHHAQPRRGVLCDMTHAHTCPGHHNQHGHLPTCTGRSPLKYDTNLSYTARSSSRHLHTHAHAPAITFALVPIFAVAATFRFFAHIRCASSRFLPVVSPSQTHRKLHTIKTAHNLEIFCKVLSSI
jgi:hypothetical protein